MKNNKTVIQLSFKNNMDEYGNKSNYIKYILRKEMLNESNEFTQKIK